MDVRISAYMCIRMPAQTNNFTPQMLKIKKQRYPSTLATSDTIPYVVIIPEEKSFETFLQRLFQRQYSSH